MSKFLRQPFWVIKFIKPPGLFSPVGISFDNILIIINNNNITIIICNNNT